MAKNLRSLLWFMAAAATGATIWLLLIPADAKNAVLLGYSLARLALLAVGSLAVAIFTWLAMRLGRDDPQLRRQLKRTDQWLARPLNLWGFLLITLGLSVTAFIALRFIFSASESAASRALLLRLAPLLSLALVVFAASFIFLYLTKLTIINSLIGSWLRYFFRSKFGKTATIILVNVLILAALLYGLEAFFRATDHCVQVRREIPFDTNDYYIRPHCYAGKEIPLKGEYTWGQLIVENKYGFRETGFATPKPEGVCRIMALGDSFTWGVGLPVEQRYTNLIEAELNQDYPDQLFEVLNFALPGAATTQERDVLAEYVDQVQPDLVIVGFFYNDPEPPRGSPLLAQADPFEDKYGAAIRSVTGFLKRLGLPFIAAKLDTAIHNLAVRSEAAQEWYVVYDAYYDPASQAWGDFQTALAEIVSITRSQGNPPPIFALLTNELFTEEELLNTKVQYIHRWQQQAESAARAAGFQTVVYDEDLASLNPAELSVNRLDTHPSAKVNLVFAQKLVEALAALYQQGILCP